MKAVRHLTLAMFLVSFTCIAAYGQVCHSYANTQADGEVSHTYLLWVPNGITAHWHLQVILNNEEPYMTAYGHAQLELAIEEMIDETEKGYTHGPVEWDDTSSFTNSSGSAAPVYCITIAQMTGYDTGGGATANIWVWW